MNIVGIIWTYLFFYEAEICDVQINALATKIKKRIIVQKVLLFLLFEWKGINHFD